MKKYIWIERLTRDLYTKWIMFVEEKNIKSTEVTLNSMPDLEACFKINVNVYNLTSNRYVQVLYKSMQIFKADDNKPEIINLNLHENHLSYITKFNSYARKFQCTLCLKLFERNFNFNRHAKTCEKKENMTFPGGYYKLPRTIFDRLEEFNIRVDQSMQNYPFYAVYDMEAMLVEPEEVSGSARTWTHLHRPVCVCMCSNVDGFQSEKFVLEGNVDNLITSMLDYLGKISDKCVQLSKGRWASVFLELDALEREWSVDDEEVLSDGSDNDNDTYENDNDNGDEAMETGEYEPPSEQFLNAMRKDNVFRRFLKNIEENDEIRADYNDWSDDDNVVLSDITAAASDDTPCASSPPLSHSPDVDDVQPMHQLRNRHIINEDGEDDEDTNGHVTVTVTDAYARTLMSKQLRRLREDFDRYCSQIPIIGFNSGRYDIGLLKTRLSYHLGLHKSKGQHFVIKKNNNYVCLANDKFKFLDMMNYLPPGVSYDNFLVTFNVPVRKSYFPYEYFDSMDRLDETSLPSKESFHSSLKQCNVLENRERVQFCKLTELEGKSPTEALKILGLQTEPVSTVDVRYGELESIWRERNMSTFRDWLEYYAKLDVGPFVLGIEAYKQYFLKHRIDVFKDNVSVPGISRRLLYDSGVKQGASFSLIDKDDKDLYETLKANLIGGPSIVFCRHHKVGETFVRGDKERPCRSIVGYDANSLYLSAICHEMPVGRYVRRAERRGFKPNTDAKCHYAMFDWMDWLNVSKGIGIRHKMNSGREFRVGPYSVDGRDADTGELYEFMGCYWHGCHCKKWQDPELREVRHQRTTDRLKFIRDLGFAVHVIWECEYRRLLKNDPEMNRFVSDRLPPFCKKYPSHANTDQILESVLDDTLFGAVEVDIRVPDSWDEVDHSPDTDLSPYDYFREMSPIFCSSEIPFDEIGPLMQEYVKSHNLSKEPRTLLVGAMAAEKILLLTPLLKWYILHGLLVTKVYQVVEYGKMRCFQDFGEQITLDRRLGDQNPDKKVFSTLSKLIGNSAFGGTIMNKKFRKIKYLEGFRRACIAVNNPRFQSLNELGDDYFEVEFANSRITMDIPIQLGYSILQYAKLHMLGFYYDFLLKYVDRADFELLEMDTDSLYMAMSSTELIDIVRPSLRQRFEASLMSHCSDDYRPEVGVDDVWLPRQCCGKHEKFDSRCLGLMKLEFSSGTEMISLCSKSYVAKSDITGEVKYSSKGINRQFVDPSDYFRRVMQDETPSTAVNRGITSYDNRMMTYKQSKRDFTYVYCKRRVCSDGVHTEPLDIVVMPLNKSKTNEFDHWNDIDYFADSPGRPEDYAPTLSAGDDDIEYLADSPGRPEDYAPTDYIVESPARGEDYERTVSPLGERNDDDIDYLADSPGRPEDYACFDSSLHFL
ncbi:MAG: hypothetical protein ABW168_27535 [Sedimenticola sp.]